MTPYFFILTVLSLSVGQTISATSSPIPPFTSYQYSTDIQNGVADLWWSVDHQQKQITFELHVNTTGWIALGISPAGGMKGADIGLGWIDRTGQLHFEDRYAYGKAQPVVDNTTTDWVGLQGREMNGWTAIQFRRRLDTCDTMDVPIKSGTNIVICAFGMQDPDMSGGQATITYHGDHRYTKMIPLQSYGNPSSESKFADLDYFDFRLNNYKVPMNDTTYHCKIYRAPTNYRERRHAIAHKTMIDTSNRDIVHHLLMYECSPAAVFDDDNLPDDVCENLYEKLQLCTSNIATGWAVGGDDIVEFPEVAGYPVGGSSEIKYYLVEMHYDNPHRMTNRSDSSGIRFYLGKQLRQHDLGYLTFGVSSSPFGVAIPPRADRFIIDSYCPSIASKRFPETGITVVSAFPHTHLQGRTVWTKIIRNGTAVQYLFNGESFDFNYQFTNRLPEPIRLYRGDEFATRCIYTTKDKTQITLGGEATKNEMCLHMFTYYPRMNDLYGCMTLNDPESWREMMNSSSPVNLVALTKWLQEREWTDESITEWQEFFNNAPKLLGFGGGGRLDYANMTQLPKYKDLEMPTCVKSATGQNFISLKLLTFITFAVIYSI